MTFSRETPLIDMPIATSQHARLAWLEKAISSPQMFLSVSASDARSARRAAQEMNNLAGETIAEWIEDQQGGGLRLTPRGRRLAVALVAMRQEQERLLQRFGGHFADDLRLLDRVAVRTSARNQFFCRVQSIVEHGMQQTVQLCVPGGQTLNASITKNSVESLGLSPGKEVVALVKASAMLLSSVATEPDFDGYNRLDGHVCQLQRQQDQTEVQVDLGAGLTAIVLTSSILARGLTLEGKIAVAFRPADVILGVMIPNL